MAKKQKDAMPLRLEWRSPAELAENPRNWRRHPENQVAALSDALAEVGWAGALLYNETTGRLIDGHARRKVAQSQGADKVPVLVGNWTEAQEAKILATLDPLAAMAAADAVSLDALLRDVQTGSQPLADMLADLATGNGTGEIIEDEAPDPPADPITKLGDLWLLGTHRLLCGDATNAADVARVLDGAVPFLCVTDPPYGVNYDPGWRNVEAAKGNLAYADRRIGQVTNDDRADWRAAWALFPGTVIYSWHPPGATSLVHAKALQDSGFTLRMQIIWAKSNFPISRGDYHIRHEPCWYAVREGQAARRTDDRTQTTLWQINLDKNVEGGHSTQKPCECMARPIRNHEPCDVYDPFLGSGTTLIAAEQLGRKCYGMEISPAYCDVIVKRWETLTGKNAVLGE